jgi:hypothetical protein
MKIKAGSGRSFFCGSVITAKLLEMRQTMGAADIYVPPGDRISPLR